MGRAAPIFSPCPATSLYPGVITATDLLIESDKPPFAVFTVRRNLFRVTMNRKERVVYINPMNKEETAVLSHTLLKLSAL